MDDLSRVSLLQSGEDLAWDRFYNENRDNIANYFSYKGIPLSEIEELTQETFIGAFKSISSLHRIVSLIPWLYGIARHTFYLYLRDKYKKPMLFEPLIPKGDTSTIQFLSQRQKEIFYYHLIEGLSFKEISKVLGTADSTIRVSFMRAKRKLKNN